MNIQIIKVVLIVIVIVVCAGTTQASDEIVEFLGDYFNVKSPTGEHCDGYSVLIWKYKGSLIGFLNHHRGLCGDPPMGILEETVYSARTGSLSFKVKLSDGCMLQDGACIPTKDRVVFKGNFRGQLLEGVVSWFRDDKVQPVYSENVVLCRDPERFQTRDYETYAAWMKYWEPVIKRRGPQW